MINNTHYMEHYSQIERTKIAEEIKTKLLYLNQNLVDIPEIKYLMVALDLFEKYGLECKRVLVIGNPKKNKPFNKIELKQFDFLPQSLDAKKAYEEILGRKLFIQLSNDKRYKSIVVIKGNQPNIK